MTSWKMLRWRLSGADELSMVGQEDTDGLQD